MSAVLLWKVLISEVFIALMRHMRIATSHFKTDGCLSFPMMKFALWQLLQRNSSLKNKMLGGYKQR